MLSVYILKCFFYNYFIFTNVIKKLKRNFLKARQIYNNHLNFQFRNDDPQVARERFQLAVISRWIEHRYLLFM